MSAKLLAVRDDRTTAVREYRVAQKHLSYIKILINIVT